MALSCNFGDEDSSSKLIGGLLIMPSLRRFSNSRFSKRFRQWFCILSFCGPVDEKNMYVVPVKKEQYYPNILRRKKPKCHLLILGRFIWVIYGWIGRFDTCLYTWCYVWLCSAGWLGMRTTVHVGDYRIGKLNRTWTRPWVRLWAITTTAWK